MATQRQIPRVSGVDPQVARILGPIKSALESLTGGPTRAVRLSDIGTGLTFAKGKLQATGTGTTNTTTGGADVASLQTELAALIASEQEFQALIQAQIDTLTLIISASNGGATLVLDVNGVITGYAAQGGNADLDVRVDKFGIERSVSTFAASTVYSLGEFVIPTVNGNITGQVYEVTVAGTSDTTEPDWSTANDPGETVVSNTVTFTARDPTIVAPFIAGDVAGSPTIGIDGDTVIDSTIPYRAIDDASALSVLGRALNSSGVLADIQAGTNDRLLTRVADVLSFTQLTLGMFPNGLVTNAKLADMVAGHIKGRITSDGAPQDLTPDEVVTLLALVFADITDTIGDAQVPESAVTQHQAALAILTSQLTADGVVPTFGYTVGTLPAGTIGDRAYVTDATAPVFLTTLVGGGAVVCPAFFDGTNWVAG